MSKLKCSVVNGYALPCATRMPPSGHKRNCVITNRGRVGILNLIGKIVRRRGGKRIEKVELPSV